MFHMAGGKGLSTLEHELHGGGVPAPSGLTESATNHDTA